MINVDLASRSMQPVQVKTSLELRFPTPGPIDWSEMLDRFRLNATVARTSLNQGLRGNRGKTTLNTIPDCWGRSD